MKLFKTIQKYFAVLGLHVSQFDRGTPFNAKNSIILILFIAILPKLGIFLFCKVQTFEELIDAFYAFISLSNYSLIYAMYILKMDKLFTFIAHFEDIIQNSMFK